MRLSRVLLLVLLPVLLTTDGQTQRNILARVGDVANGAIMLESAGRLLLNPKPCAEGNPDSVIEFHQPYAKRSLGNKGCPNGRAYEEFSVEQQQ